MDSETRAPEQFANGVFVPTTLFHQMAACFYGDGPTYAQVMGLEDGDAPDEKRATVDDGGSGADDMDDEAPFEMRSTFRAVGHGIRGSNGTS